MSSNKENTDVEKKKKNRPRLSIKIFSGNVKKKDSHKKLHEEFPSLDGSYKSQNNADSYDKPQDSTDSSLKAEDTANSSCKVQDDAEEKPSQEIKEDKDDIKEEGTVSDTSKKVVSKAVGFKPGRRRSLSACADVQDTRIKIKTKDEDDVAEEEEEEEEEEEADQLSPLPCSPTKSCLRGRSATFGYEGEVVETVSRPRSVSFSPDTVDPTPRNLKYRAWIEARTKPPPVNVKHEKHKQKMSQLKKVNMSDYLSSRKAGSGGGGILASSSSAFGGGGMMM